VRRARPLLRCDGNRFRWFATYRARSHPPGGPHYVTFPSSFLHGALIVLGVGTKERETQSFPSPKGPDPRSSGVGLVRNPRIFLVVFRASGAAHLHMGGCAGAARFSAARRVSCATLIPGAIAGGEVVCFASAADQSQLPPSPRAPACAAWPCLVACAPSTPRCQRLVSFCM